MRFFVTGGVGFIGSNLVDRLLIKLARKGTGRRLRLSRIDLLRALERQRGHP